MKEFVAKFKEKFKGRVSGFRGKHSQVFSVLVLILILGAISAGAVLAANRISDIWVSSPIEVTPKLLVISSSNFTTPTEVEVGEWSTFTITLENPNPTELDPYTGVEVRITISGEEALTLSDVSLLGEVSSLAASDGSLVGVITGLSGAIDPGQVKDEDLQILFNQLGTYWIEVQATGTYGS